MRSPMCEIVTHPKRPCLGVSWSEKVENLLEGREEVEVKVDLEKI
jgi:hypothetical protein